MIVNNNEVLYCTIELTAEDIMKMLKDEDVWESSRAVDDDQHILVRAYCCNPQDFKWSTAQ